MVSDQEDQIVTATRDIPASAQQIFDLLADPSRHTEIDGSDTVQKLRSDGPTRLSLGAKFGMDMKFSFLPYAIYNEVIEFEEPLAIAWRHLGHHVWRYELEPLDDATTRVTESFNWGEARFPPMYEWLRYPSQHEGNMARSLERLDAIFSGDQTQ